MYHLKQVFKESGEQHVRPLGESYSFFSRSTTGFLKASDDVDAESIDDNVYAILKGDRITQVLNNGCLYYIMTDDGRTIERL